MGALPARGWEVSSHMSRRRSTRLWLANSPKGSSNRPHILWLRRVHGAARLRWLTPPHEGLVAGLTTRALFVAGLRRRALSAGVFPCFFRDTSTPELPEPTQSSPKACKPCTSAAHSRRRPLRRTPLPIAPSAHCIPSCAENGALLSLQAHRPVRSLPGRSCRTLPHISAASTSSGPCTSCGSITSCLERGPLVGV